jgi:hypothetical protein
MSEASFSGSGFRKQTQVLLTVGDISEAELSQLPLINCPFCPDCGVYRLGGKFGVSIREPRCVWT